MDYLLNNKLPMQVLVLLGALFLLASTEDINIIPFVRSNLRVSMSSTWNECVAENAVDGIDNSSAKSCNCCAGTISGPSWWRLDLGAPYMIMSITFIGRRDQPEQSRNFVIYNGFLNGTGNRREIWHNTAMSGHEFSKTFSNPVLLQYVEITSTEILTICELKLFQNTEFVDLGQARASMSSEYQNPNNHRTFLAHYAIDGNETTKPDQCFCCAGASRSPSSWMLDLRKHYLVQGLIFIGRDDGFSYQSRKFTVYKGFSNTSETRWLLYNNTASDGYKFRYNFSSPTLMQHLEIRSPGILTICELKLIRAVCIDGMFGDDCQSHCQCYQGATCHAVTGECPNHKCALGRKGFNCSQVCDYATFGDGCLFSCHCYQADNCNAVTGECPNQKCAPGWKGLNCSLVCDPGTFGDGCNSHCNCYHNAVCNTTTGECPDQKCAAGWKDLNCSLACDAKTFGEGCRFPCHCNNSVQCDRMSGSCPLNRCDVEWSGNNCSIDANLIRRIGHQVHVTSSQPHFETWAADKAIDFIESSNPESCDCCSGSKGRPAWFKIDLGAPYPINTIIFIGRKDGPSYQSRNFSMYDGFREVNQERMLIYKNNATSGHKFVISFHQPLILQYVEIYSVTELTICEIKFIESERCPPGYFGRHCTERCFCNDRLSCNRLTGACQHPGCLPGWQGVSCNKSCDFGFFGDDCGSQCHCFNNVSCPSVSGNCSNEACAPGWQGLPTCSKECDWGSFGNFCAQNCHCYQNVSCYNVNGYCPNGKCAPGWKTHSCSKVCDWGSFGYECSNHCHCYENASCENVNGTCSNGECAAGWRGLSCSDACGSGTFGDKCSAQCHCFHDQECEHINGICPSGMCASGWQYDNCSAACDAGKFGGSCMSECHCLGGHPCHHIDGSCMPELCAPGWWGYNCSIACVNNTYGQNCNSSCHCNTCNHISGSCDKRTCYSQWTGINCKVPAEPLTQDEPDSSPAVIIGPVVAVVVLVAVAAAVLFYRRHTRARKSNRTIRYKNGRESKQQDGLSANNTYKNATFDEHVLADEDVYHNINDVGPTEGIAVKQLWYHVRSLYQNDSQKLTQEFQSFHTNVLEQIAKAKRSRGKNDTQMAKAERIQVALTDEKCVQHYQYDANYIDGYDKSQKYIAAKGPSSITEINAFWEMIYQANVSLILMLQETKPQDKKDMMQYWAAEGDAVYGNITVKTVKFTTDTDFIIRQFEVIKTNQQRCQVKQIQYNGFATNTLPCNLTSFINFWRESIRMSDSGPLLVHGSGDGSACLYMALDILYAQAIAERYVNPGEITRQICSQRGNLIQTKEQYGLLYEALAEALHIKVRPISAKEFPRFVTALREEDPLKRQSGIVLQYETLFGIDSEYFGLQQMQQEHEYSSLSLSSKKRSYSEGPALPDRSTAKPLLINLQNFANQNAFILTSVDDGITNCKLWKTIDKRKIKTIISLDTKTTIMNLTKDDSPPENTIYSVRSLESKKENGCFINTYAYKRKNEIEAEVKSVTSFHFLEWGGEDTLPKTVESVKTFANAIKRCQPEITEEHPVLLICRSDMNKLGIFYIVLSEFERIRQIEEVNIIETALRLKEGHSNLTPSFEAYQFCHTVIMDFIQDSAEYASV